MLVATPIGENAGIVGNGTTLTTYPFMGTLPSIGCAPTNSKRSCAKGLNILFKYPFDLAIANGDHGEP